MPVTISYAPVGAVGNLAQSAYYNRMAQSRGGGGGGGGYISRGQDVNAEGDIMTPQEQIAQNNFYRQMSGGGMQSSVGSGPPGTFSGPGGGQQNGGLYQFGPDAQGFGGGETSYDLPDQTQEGVDEATGQTVSMPGPRRSLKVNLKQKDALDNLTATGATGDTFNEGLRKIMGLPEPLVDYTVPEGSGDDSGTVLRLTASQAAARMQADRAAKAKADQFDSAQKLREKIATDTLQAKYDSIDAQDKRTRDTLDARMKALKESKAPSEVKAAAAAAAAKLKVQNELADTDIAHAKSMVTAQQKALNAYENSLPYKKSNDPAVAAYKAAIASASAELDTAYEAKRKMLADHVTLSVQAEQAATMPAAPATAPAPMTAPATRPAATQPTAAALGPTAVNPKGERVRLNLQTRQWDPVP